MSRLPAFVSLDDLSTPEQFSTLIAPLKSANPDLRATVYCIPSRLGAPDLPAWVTPAIHGFWHSHSECLAWTSDKAIHYLRRALELGYSRVFKAPNWQLDAETEHALIELGITLHAHEDYVPSIPGLRIYKSGLSPIKRHRLFHTHVTHNPSTDHLGTARWPTSEAFLTTDTFLTIDDLSWVTP